MQDSCFGLGPARRVLIAAKMPGRKRGIGLDARKFLKSWNGILFILFIGFYLMFPAIKGVFVADDPAKPHEVSQIQTFVGGLAVIWALRAAWGRLREKNNE